MPKVFFSRRSGGEAGSGGSVTRGVRTPWAIATCEYPKSSGNSSDPRAITYGEQGLLWATHPFCTVQPNPPLSLGLRKGATRLAPNHQLCTKNIAVAARALSRVFCTDYTTYAPKNRSSCKPLTPPHPSCCVSTFMCCSFCRDTHRPLGRAGHFQHNYRGRREGTQNSVYLSHELIGSSRDRVHLGGG